MGAVRLRVAPRVAAGQPGGRVEPGRLLPLRLRRQPPPRPAGVRVGFVPAHVQHGLLRPDLLGHAEHRPDPLRPVPAPVQRGGQPGALPVIPAGLSPPARVVVSAVRDELGVRAAGHRGGVEEERRHVHGVRGPLVVQRPGLGRGAHAERAARDGHLGRAAASASAGAGPGAAAASTGAPSRIWWVISIVSSCCDLVLGDHPEREPVAEQPRAALRAPEPGPLEQVEDPAPDLLPVGPGLGGRQQRQRRPLGARMLERVVERVDLRAHGLAPADLAQQPELFLVGDVGQVPDQRGHQRRVLPDQVRLVHAVGEQRRPLPCPDQLSRDRLTQCLGSARSCALPPVGRPPDIGLAARTGR